MLSQLNWTKKSDLSPRIRRATKRSRRRNRRGAYLAMFTVSLTLFFGILAMVYDLALINYTWRHCQNAADAAALAGGKKIIEGNQSSVSNPKALEYLATLNNTDSTIADIHSPPTSGPYANVEGYLEIIARKRVHTLFLRLSPFSKSYIDVTARAVAGAEAFLPEDGVITLNPNARPGLSVSGTAALKVNGRIAVNSEGGGVDEYGNAVNNGNNGVAISGGSPNSEKGVFARIIDSVGGVDNPSVFKPLIPGEVPPLHTKVQPEPDPYLNVVTPMASNGLDARLRGSVSVTNNNVTGLNSDTTGQNHRATNNESVAGGLYSAALGDVILYPGIYDSISITGGKVYFVPGIYVLRSLKANQDVLKLTGGTVIAEGLMFYNTGGNFNPTTGLPDSTDLTSPPPSAATTTFGSTAINSSFHTSPIDTTKYNYSSLYSGAKAISKDFNGMMFYQRRHNTQVLSITGNTSETSLTGTFYGKWMPISISGQGKYDAQFVVSDMKVTGSGVVEVTAGNNSPKAMGKSVYLVE
jgi:hypothetical protein